MYSKSHERMENRMKILVACPCTNKVDTDFMTSLLQLERVPDTHFSFMQGSLVYDSRNAFAVNAITQGYDRILFVDSDMVLTPDTLKRLSADMDTGLDYVTGLCFSRQSPIKPMIYKTLDVKKAELNGMDQSVTEHWFDYPKDALFRIQGSGTGCVMISVPLIKAVWDAYGPAFLPSACMGEDLAFCHRVNQLHVPMYCDSRVKVGHIGPMTFNEDVYIAQCKTREALKAEQALPDASIPDMRKQKRK